MNKEVGLQVTFSVSLVTFVNENKKLFQESQRISHWLLKSLVHRDNRQIEIYFKESTAQSL